jgi:hypothetical protein
MGVLVVVEEFRHSIVMASSNHPRRSLLQSNCSDPLAPGTTAGWHKTYISSHTSACRRYSAHSSPRPQSDNHRQDNHTGGRGGLTSISSSLLTRIPFRLTTWRYFRPLRTSCWTWNTALMRKLAPSLIVNGLSFSPSSAPGADRSTTTSSRPWTSSASDLMMHFRVSFASAIGVPVFRPSDAFHRFRDSSFLSVGGVCLLAYVPPGGRRGGVGKL